MKILGISAYYHDSAAALIVDGKIIAAAQEERFNRKKNCADFPIKAIRYCLDEAGLQLNQLDAITFYDKPLLKFERLLESYYQNAPKGLVSFVNAMPVWLKEKLFLKSIMRKELAKIGVFDSQKVKFLFTEHHLSHAASAYFTSPYAKSAIVSIDGVGEWATTSIGLGEDNKITFLKELHYPNSIGLLYSAFTYYLRFRVNHGEYKMMGLAPYGNINAEETQNFIHIIKDKLVQIYEDGSIHLPPKLYTFSTSMRMVSDHKWKQILNIPKRDSKEEINQSHCNLALAIQKVTEEIILKIALEAKKLTNADYLCLAGGVALNCVANGKIKAANIFKDVFIQPAAGDAGGALGAALASHYIYYNNKLSTTSTDKMDGAYLGPSFSEKEIKKIVNQYNGTSTYFENFEYLCNTITELLIQGHVIGWFQDRMEFGPRALGNRSIIADVRNNEMQKTLNLKIKYRESFRPFAPIVLQEDLEKYFEFKGTSPYMLMTAQVKKSYTKTLPSNYSNLTSKEKLALEKSDFPAITHVDNSARLQSVDGLSNPKMHQLLKAFKDKTGIGMLVNTSFNIKDEPIVCTPKDALNCFLNTEMDVLVLGNYVLRK